jgi:PhnB protein
MVSKTPFLRPISSGGPSGQNTNQTARREGDVPTRLNPYLAFKDNAREGMEFYHSVLGGTLQTNTFRELGGSQDPSEDDKIMHSILEADNGMVLMGADTPDRMEYSPGTNISISLSGDDESQLRGYFDKLSTGGTVTMPLEKAIWGDIFGMFTDKFGIDWLVNISSSQG